MAAITGLKRDGGDVDDAESQHRCVWCEAIVLRICVVRIDDGLQGEHQLRQQRNTLQKGTENGRQLLRHEHRKREHRQFS